MKLQRKSLDRQTGFSLIELMIVIAIIGLLISVGTIGFKTAVRSGNETAAIETLDKINKLQINHATTHRGEYGTFDDLIKDSGLDKIFTGEKPSVNGYYFVMKLIPKGPNQPAFYSVSAEPVNPSGIGASGKRYFYIDPVVGNIRVNDQGVAGPDDPSLQQ